MTSQDLDSMLAVLVKYNVMQYVSPSFSVVLGPSAIPSTVESNEPGGWKRPVLTKPDEDVLDDFDKLFNIEEPKLE